MSYRLHYLISLFLFMFTASFSVAGNATDVSGTVNCYVKGDGNPIVGANSITFTGSFRPAGCSISANDTLLLVQSQGAEINATNTDRYGDGVGQGVDVSTIETSPHGTENFAGGAISQTAGTFEYIDVSSISGNTITLKSQLKNSFYDDAAANWQIVVVPDKKSAGIRLVGNVTAEAWNGHTGGIIALLATGGEIDFNGKQINAAAKGFRGGVESNIRLTEDNIATVASSGANGEGGKGEGIAGTPTYVFDGTNANYNIK